MLIGRQSLPNALSLSRLGLAGAFLLVYSNTSEPRFLAAVLLGLMAVATDFLDGYLARRWKVASEAGYFLDGLGDKGFYLAIYLTMLREKASAEMVVWLLIGREIVLYALRSLDEDRAHNIARLRPYSRAFALFIRLYFVVFLLRDGARVMGVPIDIPIWFGELFGVIALVLGYIAIVQLVRGMGQAH